MRSIVSLSQSAFPPGFPFFKASGRITTTAPLPAERRDGDRLDLPRIMLQMNQFRVGGLHRLIRALNALASAQTAPVSAPSARSVADARQRRA